MLRWQWAAVLLAIGAAYDSSVATAAPCRPGSRAAARARSDLREVDALIGGLRDDGDVAAANRSLAALLASPCFAASEESTRDFPAQSALSLRTFWESGGRDWARSCLERQIEPTRVKDVVVPPDVRPSLSVENRPKDVPAELLCPAADAACGETTRDWLAQADESLHDAAVARAAKQLRPLPDGPRLAASCLAVATKAPAPERYMQWRQCLESRRPCVPSLPLANYRAPVAGWFVVRGARQGESQFCWELHAYHLETGAAQIARICAPQVPARPPGVRPPEASEAAPRLTVSTGTLDVGALRKLLWMAALSRQVVLAQTLAIRCPLPPGFHPHWPKGTRLHGRPGRDLWSVSDTTQVRWRWVTDRPLASGAITWPPVGSSSGDEQAGRLLRAMEGTLAEGCPPARVPAEVLEVGQDDDPLEAAYDAQLRAALLQIPTACGGSSR